MRQVRLLAAGRTACDWGHGIHSRHGQQQRQSAFTVGECPIGPLTPYRRIAQDESDRDFTSESQHAFENTISPIL